MCARKMWFRFQVNALRKQELKEFFHGIRLWHILRTEGDSNVFEQERHVARDALALRFFSSRLRKYNS